MTQYVFGYGTGRCGTQSLARLLDIQKSSYVTHEIRGLHWWPVIADYEIIKNRMLTMGKHSHFVGDVAYTWIQYLPQLMEDFPFVKFIHIWRDKEEVVESFWKVNQDRIEAEGGKFVLWKAPAVWETVYPFFGYPPSKDQIAKTYDTYIKMAEYALLRYRKQTFSLKTASLNDMGAVRNLLDFVGIPTEDQIVEHVKANVGGQSTLELNFVPYRERV